MYKVIDFVSQESRTLSCQYSLSYRMPAFLKIFHIFAEGGGTGGSCQSGWGSQIAMFSSARSFNMELNYQTVSQSYNPQFLPLSMQTSHFSCFFALFQRLQASKKRP